MGVTAANPIKPGTIAPYAGGTVPAGWLLCYGQAVSRADYAGLFAAIGTLHGAGDGSTTFNLPDYRGRAIFGKDDMGGAAANRLTSGVSGVAGNTLGAVGGAQSVTLTTGMIPAHSHIERAGAGTGGAAAIVQYSGTGASVSNNTTGNSTATDGGTGGAHGNIPPAAVANVMIKF